MRKRSVLYVAVFILLLVTVVFLYVINRKPNESLQELADIERPIVAQVNLNIIDEHPKIGFEVDQVEVQRFVNALGLNQDVIAFKFSDPSSKEEVDSVQVKITDGVYNKTQYTTPNGVVYRSYDSKREGSNYVIEIGFNDLSKINQDQYNKNDYFNWLVMNSIVDELGKGNPDEYNLRLLQLRSKGIEIVPDKINIHMLRNVNL